MTVVVVAQPEKMSVRVRVCWLLASVPVTVDPLTTAEPPPLVLVVNPPELAIHEQPLWLPMLLMVKAVFAEVPMLIVVDVVSAEFFGFPPLFVNARLNPPPIATEGDAVTIRLADPASLNIVCACKPELCPDAVR